MNIDKAYIKNIITSKAEETTYLEFKGADALNTNPNAKKEITKDVSAFANADGGIMIYGIKEIDHKANSFDFIDGRTYTKEWLQQVCGSISRNIPNLEILPIRFNNKLERSIYVLKIPRSNEGAHQAIDGRFYKRRGVITDIMQEYEVRDSYSRNKVSILKILEPSIKGSPSYTSAQVIIEYRIDFVISIHNTGPILEEKLKLEVQVPKELGLTSYDSEFNRGLNRVEENSLIYQFSQKSIVFPNDKISFIKGSVIVREETFELLKEQPVKVKLYYSGGTDEKDLFFYPLFFMIEMVLFIL